MNASLWITIAVAIIGSGAVNYMLLRRWRQRDERELRQYQHSLDAKLDSARALADRERQQGEFALRRLEEKMRTQYSWLYVERAQSMMAIYASLLGLHDAVDAFSRSFGKLSGDTSGGPSEKWNLAVEAGEAFRKLYQPKRLLFSSEIAGVLDDINRRHVAVLNRYYRELVLAKRDEYMALSKMMSEDGFRELPDAFVAAQRLEAEFRSLFGTLERVPASV